MDRIEQPPSIDYSRRDAANQADNDAAACRTWRGGRRRSVVGRKADLTIATADFGA
jgi:hypothetical protein